MIKLFKLSAGAAALLLVMALAPIPAHASGDKTTGHDAGYMMKGGFSVLGSKLIGTNIINSKGEDIGEVKDIMLDSKGTVRYVAVSYGGFMGLGDKLFAVPMSAFKIKRDTDQFFGDFKLVLDISKKQLENEKGFDEMNWPSLDDNTLREKLDRQYKVRP
jgi:sporulation protein YlmC with PRC-barrel domain